MHSRATAGGWSEPAAARLPGHHDPMPLFAFEGRSPDVSPAAWIAPTATLVGDVRVEADASVWYGAVLRADFGPIIVRRGANVQDGSVLHGGADPVTEVGPGATIGHLCVVHGAVIGEEAWSATARPCSTAPCGTRALVAAGMHGAARHGGARGNAGRRHPGQDRRARSLGRRCAGCRPTRRPTGIWRGGTRPGPTSAAGAARADWGPVQAGHGDGERRSGVRSCRVQPGTRGSRHCQPGAYPPPQPQRLLPPLGRARACCSIPARERSARCSSPGVSASQIARICITHFHGDHCLGLPGVLQRMSLDEVAHEVQICYPAAGRDVLGGCGTRPYTASPSACWSGRSALTVWFCGRSRGDWRAAIRSGGPAARAQRADRRIRADEPDGRADAA